MDGIHVVEVTYEDGRVERIPCKCDWCDVWRAFGPQIESFLAAHEPEIRPEWLGKKIVIQ
jgi:hypothetical protein